MNDVVIIGSGPAGYTAAIYLSRGGFKPLVLTGNQPGGQLIITTEIENFPGFESISGRDLMAQMRRQAEKFGAKVVIDQAEKIEKTKTGFKIIGFQKEYLGRAVIIATGASARWLKVPGVGKFKGKGVSACATCDGPFFKGKTAALIGGGDTAFTEVEFLARFAKKIYLIHRREEFRAQKILQDRVAKIKKAIPLFNSQVLEFLGEEKLVALKLETRFKTEAGQYHDLVKTFPEKYGKKLKEDKKSIIWQLPVEGAFIAIGHNPNTGFLKGTIELDEKGYLKTKNEVFTSAEGIFAAGDCVDWKYRQAIIAAGMGCKAAIEVEEWLKKR